jgi:hypothetical protein
MEDLARIATVAVSKKKALLQSGPRKGKLRKGCFFKGKKAYCTPEVAKRLGKKGGSKKARNPMLPSKGGMPNIRPKTPEAQLNYNIFQALMSARRIYKHAPNCDLKVHAARKIILSLNHMSRLPVKATKKNPTANSGIRNARYWKERDRVAAETTASCGGGTGMQTIARGAPASPAQRQGRVASEAEYAAHMARMNKAYGMSGMSRRRR